MFNRKVLCVAGMSSYWCWTLLDRSSLMQFGGFVSGVDVSLLTGVTMIAAIGILVLMKFATTEKMWRSISIAVAMFAVLSFGLLLVAFASGGEPLLSQASSIALAVLRSGLMVIWFTWLVAFEQEKLIQNLITCTAVTVAMFLFAIAMPPGAATALYFAMILLSGILIVAIDPRSFLKESQSQGSSEGKKGGVFVFYLVRFALGAAVGLAAALLASHEVLFMDMGQQVVAFAMFALLILSMFLFRKSRSLPFMVILVPLLLSVFLVIPIALQPEMLLQLSASFIWFCTIYISSIHIFFNKGLNGMGLPVLAASAQLVASAGTFVCNSLFSAGFFQAVFNIPIVYRVVFSLAVFYGLLIVSVYALERLVTRTQKEEKREVFKEAVLCLAKEYSLTRREEEVLELLAAGYSRPYISEKLVLSTSTVKTHVNHLYKKLDINKRDDLLELIEYAKGRCSD